MIDRIKQHPLSKAMAKASGWAQGLLAPAMVRQRVFRAAFVACLLAVIYWGWIASDRYVSEAHVIIQRTDMAGGQAMDFSSLLAGVGGGNRADQLLLRDYLLSMGMLDKLEAKLHLRAHYSDRQHDPISRMWSRDEPQEWFYRYYLSHVSVDFDDYAGVLIIKAQGYDPKTAQAITTMLIEEGERSMNNMSRLMAQEQLAFIEKQVTQMSQRFQQARQDVIAYQNKKGMVSPLGTAEHVVGAINQLDAQRIELQARRSALLSYLTPQAPNVVELNVQLDAIDKQLAQEQARLTAPNGKTLNSTVEEYQRLEMTAKFAEDVYKTALVALEKGHVEATRLLKKVSILQAPTLPQYPEEPRRIYNIIVFILVAMLIAGILHLLAAIIRDHKD
ncbi:MAG TPA: chain-length determining protein [Paucimonas sp.]|nr:chain-length determining protein [Paucimonas sp.]HJW55200.1 chain-length determining protein [Burkholderiaceae bacterium]